VSGGRQAVYVIRRSPLVALVRVAGRAARLPCCHRVLEHGTAGEGAASMDQSSKVIANERPIHRACLVAGCPCRADAAVSRRHSSLIAVVAPIGEAAGRHRSPDPTWRFVGLPIA